MNRIVISSLAGVLLGASAQFASAASVDLTPISQTVSVGSTFSVGLSIDFSDEPTLGGGVDVFYDSSFVEFESFTL